MFDRVLNGPLSNAICWNFPVIVTIEFPYWSVVSYTVFEHGFCLLEKLSLFFVEKYSITAFIYKLPFQTETFLSINLFSIAHLVLFHIIWLHWWLTLSWRRSLPYRNQSIDLFYESVDWFLHDRDLRHEKIKDSTKGHQ